ncbi:MAG: hypothetical protein SP1CHLAM54_17110 [Chlamydiia bacterium]|nr:hypothetical protein [Chlamydiia bacterium]MCH9616599.1 hypothetical protein [Chlamydiia bacterium]MCH9629329.1 hypothetical protein [Chlamydiia bacterium]
MNTLFIDTSSNLCFLGVDKLYFFEKARDISLYAAKIDLSSIDEIAVGMGPGTFTGTRIGVMFGKALAKALDVPIRGFSSLKRNPPPGIGPFQAISDAKSRGFYTLKGSFDGQNLTYEAPVLVEQVDQSLPITSEKSTIVHLKNIEASPKINLVY